LVKSCKPKTSRLKAGCDRPSCTTHEKRGRHITGKLHRQCQLAGIFQITRADLLGGKKKKSRAREHPRSWRERRGHRPRESSLANRRSGIWMDCRTGTSALQGSAEHWKGMGNALPKYSHHETHSDKNNSERRTDGIKSFETVY